MNFDFILLQQKIETATRLAFTEMVDLYKQEGIYAFALYSDEGAMTVCPSTNTLDKIAHLSNNNPADLVYKFEPAEWKYEMMGADKEFNDISRMLYNYVTSFDTQENQNLFTQFQEKVFNICIDVLAKLKKEEFFTQYTGRDIFLIFSVSDYEFGKEKLKEIIFKLNNKDYCDEYLAWLAAWGSY